MEVGGREGYTAEGRYWTGIIFNLKAECNGVEGTGNRALVEKKQHNPLDGEIQG